MRLYLSIGMAVLAAAAAAPGVYAQQAWAQTQIMRSNTPYLGIGVKDIDADSAKKFNLKDVRGVEITTVEENSPAAKAGLKEGDVVLEYNGQPVEGAEQLTRLVRETPAGRAAKLGVWRGGSMHTLAATVEERKGGPVVAMPDMRAFEEQMRNLHMPEIEVPSFSMSYSSPRLGVMGESLRSQSQLAEFFGVQDGLLVKSVTRNSAAEKAGIKAGDVIVKVDDERISTSSDITRALREARSKKTVTVTVVRQKKETPLTVTVETPAPAGSRVRAGVVLGPGYIHVGNFGFGWGGVVVAPRPIVFYQ